MPNTLSALPASNYKLSHDPTANLAGNVPSDIGTNPYGALTDELLFGAGNEILQLIDDATGLDFLGLVTPLEHLLGANTGLLSGLLSFLTPALGTTTPNVLSPITSLLNIGSLASLPFAIGQLGVNSILALLNLGGTGTATNGAGTSSTDPLGGLLTQLLSVPADLWALLLGTNASQQSQINALQSGGFSYDPGVNGVSGWTTLTPTALVLSSRGPFIQATVETVAYRSSGLSVDKYGASMVINPTMRGLTGLGICADSAGSNWVGLLAYRGFDGDSLWLVTAASPTLWVTQKQVDLMGPNKLSGLVTLDLKTDGVNRFTSLVNGKEITGLAWTDTGSLAQHNSTHRGVMLVSNGLNSSDDGSYGPAITGKVVSYNA